MILKEEKFDEFYPNGQLRYTETRAFVSTLSAHLYDRRVGDIGKQFIRIGVHEKYNDNGIMEWALVYDNVGNVIESKKGFQKDGTPRTY